MSRFAEIVARLEALIATRKGADPASSYTAKLLAGGPALAAKKFGEEAVETVIAAVENDRGHLIAESADVLFHLLVLLKSRGITLEDVEDALTVLAQTQLRSGQVQEQVDALVKARDLSEQAYRSGSITLTDVLNADSELLSARDELDSSRANAARAAVGVYRALGGGWTPATSNGPHVAQSN